MRLPTSILLLSLVFPSAFAAESWPLPASETQHARFLQWAQKRVVEVKDRPDSVDLKPDAELSKDEAYLKFNVPSPISLEAAPVPAPSDERIRDMRATAAQYFKVFGRDTVSSFLWSGVETGNPLVRQMDYRWNSLREAGMYDPAARQALIRGLKQAGIHNVRFGLSNHEIRRNEDGTWDQKSWAAADAMISDLAAAGIRISLDLHHFGIESRFCVDAQGKPATYKGTQRPTDEGELCDKSKYDPSRSFYLNDAWPDYFADFALEAFKRYQRKVQAYTIMNEPETVTGFNAEMWHGGFPGWTGPEEPRAKYWAALRAIRIGLASVQARQRIEDYIASRPARLRTRPLFIHTEAMVPKLYWQDFNLIIRYLTSDTILGQDWLTQTDFAELARIPLNEVGGRFYWAGTPPEKRTVLQYIVNGFIWWGFDGDERAQEGRRQKLFAELARLQRAHRRLHEEHGMTMQSYTILGVDYYAHNEDKYVAADGHGGTKEIRLEPKPELYVTQLRAGQRAGLFATAVEYFKRYPMPVMITETGTPYYFHGARWHQQMMLECAKLSNAGAPILGYTMYPAIDTWGWEHALSRPKEPLNVPEGSLYNPSGLFSLPELLDHQAVVKPFVPELLKQLTSVIPLE